jgi:hypothetical protein
MHLSALRPLAALKALTVVVDGDGAAQFEDNEMCTAEELLPVLPPGVQTVGGGPRAAMPLCSESYVGGLSGMSGPCGVCSGLPLKRIGPALHRHRNRHRAWRTDTPPPPHLTPTRVQVELGPASHRRGLLVGGELGRRGGKLHTLRLFQGLGDPWLEAEHTGADEG